MKNVTVNVAPLPNYPVPPPMPAPPFNPTPVNINSKYAVNFSAQFDTEEEALLFAHYLLSVKSVERKPVEETE